MEISPLAQLVVWATLLAFSCYYIIALIGHPYRRRKYIWKRAEKATASIIDYKTDTNPDGIVFYYPVLKFSDKEGKKFIVDAEIGKNYKYDANKQLEICYLPDDPYQFYIVGSIPEDLYVLPFGIIAIGLIVYAICKIIALL